MEVMDFQEISNFHCFGAPIRSNEPTGIFPRQAIVYTRLPEKLESLEPRHREDLAARCLMESPLYQSERFISVGA